MKILPGLNHGRRWLRAYGRQSSGSLTRKGPDYAEWLQATAVGSVLVIGGDNLVVTESSLDINTAARLGTLVTGVVTVRSAG